MDTAVVLGPAAEPGARPALSKHREHGVRGAGSPAWGAMGETCPVSPARPGTAAGSPGTALSLREPRWARGWGKRIFWGQLPYRLSRSHLPGLPNYEM